MNMNKIVSNVDELDFLEQKFKGLASRHRVKILIYLSSGEKSLPEIIEHLKPLNSKTIFEHVSKLKKYGIIKNRRTSINTIYKISDDTALSFLEGYK